MYARVCMCVHSSSSSSSSSSCRATGFPWISLTTPPYRPLLPAGPQGYTPYRHRAAVCRFELVILPLHVHVKGSTIYFSYLMQDFDALFSLLSFMASDKN